ncbi:TRAP transporter large permease subunit [Caldimonas thermodepolymerans]|jgi:C4-dicarboxylate transporter DctM subunit|uniref:TRAP transporter large permease protein n=1 Tax=Caldimonas thermodepolymerans TaxID=215580 RepID=A0A2S5T4K6_9BURK|nr:TRAP transporter large permease subunit [Caldimonas thermodepolymerans]PPE69828.1 C4-dicarboxylate ABC transporter permease [Caldimonas thermodepolymerans]QPC32661.1 TRAP transporter large permease subunit [Caldimonas thermodepolymerans]RDI03416.1 tripartite ATP-independent transporter DctM subunit [Caldimonas thermodepolymerans]TCP06725.1 tripartite ATP-independent transporter DctM subunit [Caldimonas thermodepolymerans]UZG45467.1 TRAP transporter large permease subunit [Caldimonas thermod
MSDLSLGALLIGALVVLVLLGIHIAVALIGIGFIGIWLVREDVQMAMRLLYLSAYNGVADYIFATIPLFVLMGLLVSVSNVGKDTFDVAESLLRRLRGGLGVATVAANTVFAAVTGVSIASAAVFTRVAVPEMVRHGYRTAFAAGTVAGSSVLGMMIPPSLLMIIYGVLAEQSIGTLFIAGIIPGFLLAAMFVVTIVALATFRPQLVYDLRRREAADMQRRLVPALGSGEIARKLVPIVALVVLVLGGLYTGFFTPTEAGGIGAFGALLVALARRSLGEGRMWRVLHETGSVSVTILILLIAAGFYSRMMSVAGIPEAISALVQDAGLGPYGFLAIYVVILLFLGMILDSSSILLIMTPVAVPIATDLGFNLIQFGVLTVLAVEMGLLTPPFGISVFTVKSTLNDPAVSVESIFAGSLPYVAAMLLVLVLVALFPALSLALV